jgi:ABC-type transport system involved in cytochrome c biogenesis permease subunit
MRLTLLLLLLFLPFGLCADQNGFDYHAFARIPILHEGRIKPLDSFARIALKKIYGDKSLPDKSAVGWLAEVMFNQQQAVQEKIFQIRSPELVNILSLPPQPDSLYNFREIASIFGNREKLIKDLASKDKKLLAAEEQELLKLYENVNLFAEIMGSFSLLMPFPDYPDVDYLEALKNKKIIDSELKQTVKEKGDRIDEYSEHEQRNAKLSFRMNVLETLDSHNSLLRVIPPSWEGQEEWLAPWAVIEKGEGSPASLTLFKNWKALAKAYNDHDAAAWKNISKELRKATRHVPDVRPIALDLEVLYNTIDPLNKSIFGYLCGVAAALAALWCNSKKWNIAAYYMVLVSAVVHGLGILGRMYILLRPPVSTLYESMIFVSFMAACFGLWLEHKRRGGESLLVSAMIAALLIMSANVFAADSDTLEVLVAVLNTNFWLATHVVCITTGYASALICGAIAHIYLVKYALGRTSQSALATLQRRLHKVALVALLFTTVGTMLGGIWADQSWGRFWGWDPKENGALWIVLWLAWLLHGRIAGQLRELGFACGMAFINIVVALAWVGVNLLSVGLHSYGFTDIAANGLMTFCFAEIIFIASITWFAVRQKG